MINHPRNGVDLNSSLMGFIYKIKIYASIYFNFCKKKYVMENQEIRCNTCI